MAKKRKKIQNWLDPQLFEYDNNHDLMDLAKTNIENKDLSEVVNFYLGWFLTKEMPKLYNSSSIKEKLQLIRIIVSMLPKQPTQQQSISFDQILKQNGN